MRFIVVVVVFLIMSISCASLQKKSDIKSVGYKTVAIETAWNFDVTSQAVHEWRNLINSYVEQGLYPHAEHENMSIQFLSGDNDRNLLVIRHTSISPEIGVLFDLIDYTNIYFLAVREISPMYKGR